MRDRLKDVLTSSESGAAIPRAVRFVYKSEATAPTLNNISFVLEAIAGLACNLQLQPGIGLTRWGVLKVREIFRRRSTAAGALAVLLSAGASQASFIETIVQSGPDVVATGSGKIDLTGLTSWGAGGGDSYIMPEFAAIATGGNSQLHFYKGISGPASFGSGGNTWTSSESGDQVAIWGTVGFLAVPNGYVSGSSLSVAATWHNATFGSLGVTPGDYVWTWGSGASADSFILRIATAAVPEPGSLALLGLGLMLHGAFLRRRKA